MYNQLLVRRMVLPTKLSTFIGGDISYDDKSERIPGKKQASYRDVAFRCDNLCGERGSF